MRRTAHLGGGSDDEHVTQIVQRSFEHLQPVRVDPIVVGQQNPRHWYGARTQSIRTRALRWKRAGRISLFVVNNQVSLESEAQLGLGGDWTWPRTALLLVAFASQSRFQLGLLSRGHEERVFFRVFDNLFGHDLPFEPPQSAFNRFTRINCNYCHLSLQ